MPQNSPNPTIYTIQWKPKLENHSRLHQRKSYKPDNFIENFENL